MLDYLQFGFVCFLFAGFGDRLLSEVKKQAPKDIKIRVSMDKTKLLEKLSMQSISSSYNADFLPCISQY